jgi:sterol desaturase/sphingolipid hydroxylase (fatty acid hydroxylase superfamily)
MEMKSLRTFVYINSALMGLSWTLLHVSTLFRALIRNVTLIVFIWYGTRNKPAISQVPAKPVGFRDLVYFGSSTGLQTVTEFMIVPGSPRIKPFLVYLFVFEVILDFLHYWTHRISHERYYRFHKTHHHHTQPRILNTYWHHPVDLILIECIPTLITFALVKGTTSWITVTLVYKSFIEISGHTGKQVAPSSCFPLCVWIPRALGIQLYTEDHDRHHEKSTCNYSKRFYLWDILFQTHHQE